MTRKILAVFLCALLVTALLPCAASAMRIQHNVTALNAHRALTNNNSTLTKNLEKLSSGYRINRAGDDAAGLAISERMRAQITGLQSVQSGASDLPVNTIDEALAAMQENMQALVDTEELAYGINDSVNPDDYAKLGDVSLFSGQIAENTLMFGVSHDLGASGMMMELDADGYAITLQLSTDGAFINASGNPRSVIIASNGVAVSDQDGVADLSLLDAYGNPLVSGRAEVQGDTLYAHTLGVSAPSLAVPVGGEVQVTADISKTAVDAPESLEEELALIADARAQLGAAQSRLEHSPNSLSNAQENLANAESRMRDVDIASEMMQYTRNNILLQSAQAMLAQANAVPQGVLQLLQ